MSQMRQIQLSVEQISLLRGQEGWGHPIENSTRTPTFAYAPGGKRPSYLEIKAVLQRCRIVAPFDGALIVPAGLRSNKGRTKCSVTGLGRIVAVSERAAVEVLVWIASLVPPSYPSRLEIIRGEDMTTNGGLTPTDLEGIYGSQPPQRQVRLWGFRLDFHQVMALASFPWPICLHVSPELLSYSNPSADFLFREIVHRTSTFGNVEVDPRMNFKFEPGAQLFRDCNTKVLDRLTFTICEERDENVALGLLVCHRSIHHLHLHLLATPTPAFIEEFGRRIADGTSHPRLTVVGDKAHSFVSALASPTCNVEEMNLVHHAPAELYLEVLKANTSLTKISFEKSSDPKWKDRRLMEAIVAHPKIQTIGILNVNTSHISGYMTHLLLKKRHLRLVVEGGVGGAICDWERAIGSLNRFHRAVADLAEALPMGRAASVEATTSSVSVCFQLAFTRCCIGDKEKTAILLKYMAPALAEALGD